jgi:triosephosphate isomerase
MRNYLIAGNWKMNQNVAETMLFFNELAKKITAAPKGVELLICPTFTSLSAAVEAASSIKGFSIGAQNMHFEDSGAFTGEINAEMLTQTGVSYVLVGHSERRQYFAETDETVNKKTIKALAKGLKPVVCVGELLSERKENKQFSVVKEQITGAFKTISASDAATVVVAYEPVWAIGTGETASPEQAQEMHAFIRKELASLYNQETADKIQILYGGSMNPKNVEELLLCQDVDGGLIGGASLKPDSFFALIESATHLKSR